MAKKRVLLPADEVDIKAAKYEPELTKAPHMTGLMLKLAVKLVEAPVIGSFILGYMKKQNNMNEMLRRTVIPETPMFKPEFPPQEPEHDVVILDEDSKSEDRVALALNCLPHYDPASRCLNDMNVFRYWKIRDYAYAYRSRLATPTIVADRIISVLDDFSHKKPPTPLLISFDAEDLRNQAAASTQRFEQGNPLSILDGIFMAIKDDIDCYPHPSKGATSWLHEVRQVREDATCVSRLRRCGVIFVGKANMHELGMGTTGNNPNHGTTRNPHALERYTGGSSSGPAAIVASGICSAALGTDGGGSVRIPSSLCGIVGLKSTYGRTDMKGSLCGSGTVEIIGPLASNVEDVLLVYAAISGSSPDDKISLKPSLPCLPNFLLDESSKALGSLRLGKYTEWFNDVFSTDISDKCEDALSLLEKTHGCKTVDIVIPEFDHMRMAHVVSIGSEAACGLSPDYEAGNGVKLTLDSRINFALFQSFTGSDYVAAQCLRRRMMYYHMEIFKEVDIIVTPTTGMTAPVIPVAALEFGETNMKVTANLMRFIIGPNLLGLPAISVPVGYDKQGLPIGLQLIGRPWAEASILRLAAAIEELCANPKKKPQSFYDVLKGN
ncbi:Fatty acid amide hydrolase [Heracleum sosnowskyi]|uniref:Fatty acid amide hydrolase n=1 Tax=Heracleum sosnowskyi TaxID=360622 RepID=A0AAD8JDI8_9APIA|nr:Fatty acid amide hydrolase [Heracleum sosnowskyi]